MKIDIEKAFTYVKNDPHWVKKFVIGACLGIFPALFQLIRVFMPDTKNLSAAQMQDVMIFIPFLLILAILGMLCSLFLSGYSVKNANIRIKNPESMLPEWNFGEYFVLGFKNIAANMIYIIALLLIVFGIIMLFYSITHEKTITTILSILFCIPVFIIFLIVLNLGFVSFTTDLKFTSYFKFNRMKKLVNKHILTFLLFIALTAGLSMLVSLANDILTLTVLGIVVIPFINFYQTTITSDLIAQFVRTAPEFDEIPNQEV